MRFNVTQYGYTRQQRDCDVVTYVTRPEWDAIQKLEVGGVFDRLEHAPGSQQNLNALRVERTS